MNLREYIKDNLIILDGGTGTILQAKGLKSGELPERWNVSHPAEIVDLHKAYFDAGSNVVNANTFGANTLKFSSAELEEIIAAAMSNLKAAREKSTGTQPKWIGFDIGPTGKMLKHYVDHD
ncbi:MAG: homocysteine S-methyltransferase family protein, partial [Clostridia bacterium]|nr:homocysteine S-methyltransferase family protein [Clostridia bacterium]